MSQLTAHTVMPLFAALSLEEQQEFLRLAGKQVSPRPKKLIKKKSVYDTLPPIFHPENVEMLVSAIMHGD